MYVYVLYCIYVSGYIGGMAISLCMYMLVISDHSLCLPADGPDLTGCCRHRRRAARGN